jgi:hypothetical protein
LHHRAHDKSPCSLAPFALYLIQSKNSICLISPNTVLENKTAVYITKEKYLVMRGPGSADDCDDQEGPEADEGGDEMIGRWRFVVFLLFLSR